MADVFAVKLLFWFHFFIDPRMICYIGPREIEFVHPGAFRNGHNRQAEGGFGG